ncbi:MAG: hypothetical protein PHH71_03075 [Clostridia bacterium]|jgi:hypothetical protein|nr:hypothetical protein [Clostridia bacterium]MDD3231941.1 hypothetical protein [Clostridia bacterium]
MRRWFKILTGISLHIILLLMLFCGTFLLGYEKLNSESLVIFIIIFAAAFEIIFVGLYLSIIFKK